MPRLTGCPGRWADGGVHPRGRGGLAVLDAVGRLRRAGQVVFDPRLGADFRELVAHRDPQLLLEDVLVEVVADLLFAQFDRFGAALALEDHELVAELDDAGKLALGQFKSDVFELPLAAEAADRRGPPP